MWYYSKFPCSLVDLPQLQPLQRRPHDYYVCIFGKQSTDKLSFSWWTDHYSWCFNEVLMCWQFPIAMTERENKKVREWTSTAKQTTVSWGCNQIWLGLFVQAPHINKAAEHCICKVGLSIQVYCIIWPIIYVTHHIQKKLFFF